MPSNQFAHLSIRREYIDLLSAKIILDIPTPIHLEKENYEEGVIYTFIFKDGGCILIHEGALMQFDIDTYKPSKVIHKKSILYIGEEKMVNSGKNMFVVVFDYITVM